MNNTIINPEKITHIQVIDHKGTPHTTNFYINQNKEKITLIKTNDTKGGVALQIIISDK